MSLLSVSAAFQATGRAKNDELRWLRLYNSTQFCESEKYFAIIHGAVAVIAVSRWEIKPAGQGDSVMSATGAGLARRRRAQWGEVHRHERQCLRAWRDRGEARRRWNRRLPRTLLLHRGQGGASFRVSER